MSDYTSYSAYVPEEENDKAPPILHQNNDQFTRASYLDGIGTFEQVERVSSFDARSVNTFPADDWRSTAKTPTGSPMAVVADSSLVTINGIQASALDFQKAGYLEKDDQGNYRLAGESAAEDPNEAQLAENRRHHAVLPPEANAIVNTALEGMSDAGVDTVTQYGVGLALGRISSTMLVQQVSTMTGSDMVASKAKVESVREIYQQQADDYIVSQHGLDRDELPGFYEFARSSQNREALSKAVNGQIYSKRMQGYEPLVRSYLHKTAPNSNALKENCCGLISPDTSIGG